MRTRTEGSNLWTPIAVGSVAVALALAFGCGAQQAHPSATGQAPTGTTASSSSAPGPAVPTPATMAACNQQPNMASALDKLREARGWLDQAEHDKGGWREAAAAATDAAIQETQRGCAYAENR